MQPLQSPQPAHYRLAPSSSLRWLNCPGSARDDLPDRDSDAAAEGTLAHLLAYCLLTDTPMPGQDAETLENMDDDARDQMYAGVAKYMTFVTSLPGTHFVEYKMASAVIAEHGGTSDSLHVTEDTLHTCDLKYGFHFVPAKGNTQLMNYLNLAREFFPGRKRFFATIVQPRVNHGRADTVEFTEAELDANRVGTIEAAFDDTIKAGPWCKWCPLLVNCDVAYAEALRQTQVDFKVIEDDADYIDKLIRLDQMEDVIVALAKQARDRMLTLIKQGRKIPGYKSVVSLGHRKWRNPVAAFQVLSERYPERAKELLTQPELKSPNQLEAIIAATVLEELDLYHRPEGPPRIARDWSELPDANVSVTDDFSPLG